MFDIIGRIFTASSIDTVKEKVEYKENIFMKIFLSLLIGGFFLLCTVVFGYSAINEQSIFWGVMALVFGLIFIFVLRSIILSFKKRKF